MALSMTAFARSNVDTDSGRITWEIHSVNSRYLELHFRLPDEFRDMEPALRECIKSRVNRGKVEIFLRFQPSQKQQKLQVNRDLVASLNDAADKVHEVIGPGNALGSFNECLKSLFLARKREGDSLTELIKQRCEEARSLSEQADRIIPQALAAQRTHLLNKLYELIENPDTERLEQEMVLLAQKADIAEETDRLRTHIDEVLDILQREEPIGRRLDFMMQELNREANTLSSKAMRTELTRIAVDLKVLIEQMREQVQNIE